MAQHTPGPWIADSFATQNDRVTRVCTYDGTATYYHRGTSICEAYTNHDEPDNDDDRLIGIVEAEANARLIAASPELLDVAEAAILFHSGGGWDAEKQARWSALTRGRDATTKGLCDFAREILAKARGEAV
jgi:hypothetical protein